MSLAVTKPTRCGLPKLVTDLSAPMGKPTQMRQPRRPRHGLP
jgi:hypothetical protein